MSHSQFHCTGRAYLDMHGLIFETSICYWQDQPGRRRWDSGPGGPQRKACVLAGRLTAGWGRRRTPGTQRPTTPAARTDDGPPDNSTEGTSGAGPHRGVAEGRGGKPQAPPPPPHPRHGPPPRRPGAPSSHVGTGRHARALARADRRGVATRAKAQGPSPPPTQERHGYDGRPAAASRVPTRAQVSSAEPGGRGTRRGGGGVAEGHPSTTRNDAGGQAGARKRRRARSGAAAGPGKRDAPGRRSGGRQMGTRQTGGQTDERERGGRTWERPASREMPQRDGGGGGGRRPPTRWGGARGPSPKTGCESAARAPHGVSPPEASSTTAVPPQHPGRRLASPSAPGGPPLAGAPRPPPTTPMSHSRPRGNKSPKAPTDDHPPHPTRTRRAQPSSPTPPRTGGHPRSTSPRDTRPATAARG